MYKISPNSISLIIAIYLFNWVTPSTAVNQMIIEVSNDRLNMIPNYEIVPDSNTMLRELFKIFDNLPKDGYLNYREIKILQYITNPELPLTIQTWTWICNTLDVNPHIGIDINAFNSSYYYPIRDIMGTDLSRDWIRVNNKAKRRDVM